MADLSDYLEGALIDHMFNKAAFTALTNVYIALYTAAPSDSGGGTEVTGGSYARVTSATSTWTRSANTIDNDNNEDFPAATASWGTVTHVGLFDAVSAGNLLCWKALASSKAIADGDTARFLAGDLDFTLD